MVNMNIVANMYLRRFIVLFYLTIIILTKAAIADYATAYNAFIAKNYDVAFKEASKEAKQGDSRAQALLGLLYSRGHGTKSNRELAIKWYNEAVVNGNMVAQFELALINIENKKYSDAELLFKKAAFQGHVLAQYNLGLIYAGADGQHPRWEKAVYWFKKAAEKANPQAQYNLGMLYSVGKGIVKDKKKAAFWLEKSAKGGHIDAALDYGIILANGVGIEKNVKDAIKWLLKAANDGNIVAQNRIAKLYKSDFGKRDLVEAAKWHILARSGGIQDDQLDRLIDGLTAKERQEAQTRADEWLRRNQYPIATGANKNSNKIAKGLRLKSID